MRVVFSAEAVADLEAIGDYIAKDSPRRAGTFLNELRQASLDLVHFPENFSSCRGTSNKAFDAGHTGPI